MDEAGKIVEEVRVLDANLIVATARKMLVSICRMLDHGEVYDPPGVSA